MRFSIYFRNSGKGLFVDAELMKDSLESIGYACDIHVIDIGKNSKLLKFFGLIGYRFNLLYFWNFFKKAFRIKGKSVAIHLENPIYSLLFRNRIHILIPNQEWLDPNRIDLLRCFSYVWCKTHLAESILSELGARTRYIGFYSGSVKSVPVAEKSRNFFLSRVGMSQYRGAEILVSVWQKHPDWPLLKLISHPLCRPNENPENVEYMDIIESREEFLSLSASALYHVYLSETEGFGHSIVEAMGAGSVVIVNDAPPMNEVADSSCALMVNCIYLGNKRLSPRFGASMLSLEEIIERAMSLSNDEIALMTSNAKARFSELHKNFSARLSQVIDSDLK